MTVEGPAAAARALVVDDEEDVREMLSLLLQVEGYSVTAVSEGDAAVRALQSTRFDVVTLDYRMPGKSGLDTLAELKHAAPGMPVIMISGYMTAADAQRCLALGAFASLAKPFAVENLLMVLRRAREAGSRPPSPTRTARERP